MHSPCNAPKPSAHVVNNPRLSTRPVLPDRHRPDLSANQVISQQFHSNLVVHTPCDVSSPSVAILRVPQMQAKRKAGLCPEPRDAHTSWISTRHQTRIACPIFIYSLLHLPQIICSHDVKGRTCLSSGLCVARSNYIWDHGEDFGSLRMYRRTEHQTVWNEV